MLRIFGSGVKGANLGLLRCVKLSLRKRRFIMNENESVDIEQSLKKLIKEHAIVIFSKEKCPFCIKVKGIFRDLNQQVFPLELDKYPDSKCALYQDVLQKMTGQRTVPNVFIHTRHLGGCSDTQQALADGTIYDMLENNSKTYDYDYVVIGGGSGGLASAKEAASFKKKVAVCDLVTPTPRGTTWGLGGTCVNVGCIPKKLMHKAAIIGEDLKDAPCFGWTTETKTHSWNEMLDNVQNYVRSLNWNYRASLKEKNVVYHNNYAKFKDNHTLELYDKDGQIKQEITSQNFLLAMGCRPSYPDFPGAMEYCITSDDIFSLPQHPGKTLIVGASYIALETAGFLQALGVDVTVMVRSILLRGFDQEVANKIGENMEAHGIKFLKNYEPVQVERKSENELLVVARSTKGLPEHRMSYKTVLLAIGRKPCTTNMGLEKLGLALDPSGRVVVSPNNQTSIRNIFAVGDLIEEKLQLTPVAIQEGTLLSQRLYGRKSTLFDYESVPTTLFTPLEYGCVGLSEEEAVSKYGKDNLEVYHSNFTPLEWDLSSRNKNKSFVKIICIKNEQERVVGLHYLGPNAGEVTQGFALALKLKATKADFDSLIGIHPTCAEVFTTMTVTKSSGKSPVSGGC